MTTVSTQSATSYGYGQVQRQMAQRNAVQLEAKAAALAAAASDARKEADAAVQRAGELETQAGSARSKAITAQQAAATGESAIEAGNTIGDQADKIYQALQSDENAETFYDQYGRSSKSPYATGTLFDISS